MTQAAIERPLAVWCVPVHDFRRLWETGAASGKRAAELSLAAVRDEVEGMGEGAWGIAAGRWLTRSRATARRQ